MLSNFDTMAKVENILLQTLLVKAGMNSIGTVGCDRNHGRLRRQTGPEILSISTKVPLDAEMS